MMAQQDRVVVVGAGPCGLAIACELLRHDVPVRVLDAEPRPRAGSRAILLWPPALEALRDAGVLAEAQRRGIRATAMNYRLGGDHLVRIPLDPVNQPLLLPQAETESLLEAALRGLGGTVERSMRVTEVSAEPDGVRLKATGPGGSTELVEGEWLVGADGVRSTVRELLGIPFAGDQFPETILVAEGRLSFAPGCALDPRQLHYMLGPGGGLLLVPLPSGRFRVGTPVPAGTDVTADLVQRLLDERGPGGVTISDLSVRSTFTGQERVAARLRAGRCFLVGDAAHTHSAIGGQGLNLGLQDVRNLSWRLAGVVAGRLRPEVLDGYDTERRYAAQQTVRTTHLLARLTLAGPAMARVRNTALRLLSASGVLRRAYPPMLAGWRLRYPGARPGRDGLPGPGNRTPSWVPAGAEEDGWHLRLATTGAPADELTGRIFGLAQRYPGLVRHEHLATGPSGFLLLRPDGYVAASGNRPSDVDTAARALAELSR
jgi:2-polyprenyl-6-methoxyphenol hydroxylase-like FAD-dependent oxidoreductase